MRTARVYAGVETSPRIPESHEDVFFVTHDAAGIDTLVSGLLEERPGLVILEATGGFERAVFGALAAEGACR